MSANGITDIQPPKLAINDKTLSFSDKWRCTWNGGEPFVNMDYCLDVNGSQARSAPGGSGEVTSGEFLYGPRASLYPNGPKVNTVAFRIRGVFEGAARWGAFRQSPVLEIKRPNVPEIEMKVTQVDGVDVLEVTVTPDKGSFERDVYDTVIDIALGRMPATPTYTVIYHKAGVSNNGFQQTELYTRKILVSWDGSSYTWRKPVAEIEGALPFGGSIAVAVSAYSRGLSGDGDLAWDCRVFAHPNVPVITGVAIAGDLVMVSVDPKETRDHPVEAVQLQILKTEDAQDEVFADAGGYSWTDVKSEDGTTRAICDTMNNAAGGVVPGTHVYYRLRSTYDDHERFSAPYEVKSLYHPAMTVAAGAAFVARAISGDDGESAIVDVAWVDDVIDNVEQDKLAGYSFSSEISWSKNEYAWDSTERPDTFDVDWENPDLLEGANAARPADMAPYTHCARVYIGGLTEGESVYVRARRKYEAEGDSGHGAYSNTASCTPASAPAWVRIDAPEFVARGKSIPLTWTFGSDAEQTGWIVTDEGGRGYAQGDDASGYALVDAALVSDDTTSLELRVGVTTGGNWKNSETATVSIVDAPTCAVSVDDVVTSLPLVVSVESDADVALAIVSRGIAYASPCGMQTQYAGDVVWSGVVPAGDVEIADVDLRNGCSYEVRATARDAATGLASDAVVREFAFELARHAPVPDAAVTVDVASRCATIVPSCPGAGKDDTCDIWRLTPDGAYRIASGVGFGSSVTDRYAPFSRDGDGLAYRICARTGDGDLAWRDVAYELPCHCLRLDWAGKHVELPYNLSGSESVAKRFEARTHLDGVTDGYWDEGAVRNASMTTDMIRLPHTDEQALVREMARYAGPVFVRTAGGLAFEADVQLEDMQETHESALVAASFRITEIELREHVVDATDVIAPESEVEGE